MSASKHAYLIMAYEQPNMLKRLIATLDDSRNDIYVHIDKKAQTAFSFIYQSSFSTRHSALSIIPPVDARWGDVSLVKVELMLIEAALQHGSYAYLHLLSDSDYPIKSQDYIHAECERLKGTEFVGFSAAALLELEIKMQRYHLFPRDFRNKHTWKHFLRKGWLMVQAIIGYRRHADIVFQKGPQWWSITSDLASYILARKEAILNTYHHTYCPDEVFMQTLCWQSPFRERLSDKDDEFIGCRRFIPWQNNTIRPFQECDIPLMQVSPCWFARKFDEDTCRLISLI